MEAHTAKRNSRCVVPLVARDCLSRTAVLTGVPPPFGRCLSGRPRQHCPRKVGGASESSLRGKSLAHEYCLETWGKSPVVVPQLLDITAFSVRTAVVSCCYAGVSGTLAHVGAHSWGKATARSAGDSALQPTQRPRGIQLLSNPRSPPGSNVGLPSQNSRHSRRCAEHECATSCPW